MAAIVGTNVGAPVVPTDTADTYPSHDANYGKGGIHHVADNTARDAITTYRRYEGLMAYTIDSGKTWQLQGGITNGDWVELTVSGSGLSLTNAADNRVLTAVDASTINGEANLTFDGSTLTVTGALVVSSTVRCANIGAGTDNSVVILDSSGYLKTDEIDNRVWGTTLADLANGSDNRMVTCTDGDSLTGEQYLTYDASQNQLNLNSTGTGYVRMFFEDISSGRLGGIIQDHSLQTMTLFPSDSFNYVLHPQHITIPGHLRVAKNQEVQLGYYNDTTDYATMGYTGTGIGVTGAYTYYHAGANISVGSYTGCVGVKFGDYPATFTVESLCGPMFTIDTDGHIFVTGLPFGSSQINAGAVAGQLWYAYGAGDPPDGTVMIGL